MITVSSQMTALLNVVRHRALVANYLYTLAARLEERARLHDLSKLELDEFAGFSQMGMAKAYGLDLKSSEYKELMEEHEETIRLHYARNPHHPEHYGESGVSAMSFLDVVEMVCDWRAANVTHGTGETDFPEAVRHLVKDRFKLSSEEAFLVYLIAGELP